MPHAIYKAYPLRRYTVLGQTFAPVAETARVNPRGLKARLVQDPDYVQSLTASGLFGLPRNIVNIRESFKLGKMPAKAPFSQANLNLIIETYADQIVLATNANEAPTHFGQLTYNAGIADPLRCREMLDGHSPSDQGVYHGLTYSKRDGLCFLKLYIELGIEDLPLFQTVVSGKPLVWDGNATGLADYLPACLSDIRHVFVSPEIDGVPLLSRQIAKIIRQREAKKLERMAASGEELRLDLKETQQMLEDLGLPSEFSAIREASNLVMPGQWSANLKNLYYPLIFNHYRHTFWAKLKSGEVLAGIISNPDPETRDLGTTFPELQRFLLEELDATNALAFGAGKDCHLYYASEDAKSNPVRIADPGHRPTTYSGIFMLVPEDNQ
jgi:hypothetical protein